MRIFWLVWFVALIQVAHTQTDIVVIDSITVEGNKRTLTRVVLREMTLRQGDHLPAKELPGELKRSRDFLMNTRLFANVQLTYKNWEAATNRVHLHVTVQENWYIYPLPYFDLADRSFNVWLQEHNASLQRVNFGIDFTHLNLTGRRDLLSTNFIYGYTRQYSIRYRLPYINRRETLGLTARIAYFRNREFNYLTEENKQVFFNDEEAFTRVRFLSSLRLNIRPGLLRTHSVELSFHQNRIDPRVAEELNPDYFLQSRSFQRYARLFYQFRYDSRDVRGYPLDGRFFAVQVDKAGLGFFDDRNALTVNAQFYQFTPLTERWFFNYWTRSKLSIIRQRQPYNDNRALGFNGDDLRGFEYYIVDGLDMFLASVGTSYEIWNRTINFGKLMPLEAFRNMPFRVYLTLDVNTGYIHNPYSSPNNPLDNRWLLGGGPGLDLVFFYDMAFRFQYSINHLGETGVFFQFNTNI